MNLRSLFRFSITLPVVAMVTLVYVSSPANAEERPCQVDEDEGPSANGRGKGGGGGATCPNPCGDRGIQANSLAECPVPTCVDRTDTVTCTPATPPSGNYTNAHGSWRCSGQPHGLCIPTPTNGGIATHTHHDRHHYNFSPTKKCCFFDEGKDECGPVTCH